jgi:hypothetical protein
MGNRRGIHAAILGAALVFGVHQRVGGSTVAVSVDSAMVTVRNGDAVARSTESIHYGDSALEILGSYVVRSRRGT